MKLLLVCFLLIFSITSVSAAMDPTPAFCEHQGYTLNRSFDTAQCIFDDGKSCDFREFYQGTCGKEYLRDFQCVPLGEAVFNFDQCCEGAPYGPSIGQATCQPLSKHVAGSIINPFYWTLLLILLIILALIYSLYRLICCFVKKK
mgnify:CR=1 FL=1